MKNQKEDTVRKLVREALETIKKNSDFLISYDINKENMDLASRILEIFNNNEGIKINESLYSFDTKKETIISEIIKTMNDETIVSSKTKVFLIEVKNDQLVITPISPN